MKENEYYSAPSLLVCIPINSFILIHLGVFWKISQHIPVHFVGQSMERTEHMVKSLYYIFPLEFSTQCWGFKRLWVSWWSLLLNPSWIFLCILFPLKIISFLMATPFCQMRKALQFYPAFAPFATFQKDCNGCMTTSQIFPGGISDFFSISLFNWPCVLPWPLWLPECSYSSEAGS